MLANLVKETVKKPKEIIQKPKEVVPKPKTVLDDLDNEILYDKPDKVHSKPVIKSVEVLQKPKIVVQNKVKEPEKPDIDTENLNFDDDFMADDYPNRSINEASLTNEKSVTIQSTDKSSNGDDLNQYIGDVSIQNLQPIITKYQLDFPHPDLRHRFRQCGDGHEHYASVKHKQRLLHSRQIADVA